METTIVSMGFFYKLTDESNHIAELSITDWHDVTDALMAKFKTIDLSKIKFQGLGYGIVVDYDYFNEEASGIIVRMKFPQIEYLSHDNYRSDLLYVLPKLFDVWYFAEPTQQICKSKVYGTLKVVTNKDYVAKALFNDIYILGYESDGIYHNIEE